MTDNTIQLNNISISRGDLILCQGINVSLDAANLLHITGANGIGKTTLLNMLAGLLPIETGSMLWKNHSPSLWNTLYVGHALGIDTRLSVFHTVEYLVNLNPIQTSFFAQTPKSHMRSLIMQAIAAVGLAGYADISCYQLSSGQKKRVHLAKLWFENALLTHTANTNFKKSTALATSRLWILDEPFATLDQTITNSLQHQLLTFLGFGGRIIFTSHQGIYLLNELQQILLNTANNDKLSLPKNNATEKNTPLPVTINNLHSFELNPFIYNNEHAS